MPSKAFRLKGDFPIGFCIWDNLIKETITQIDLDILEFEFDKKKENIVKIKKMGIKSFYDYKAIYINDWLPKTKPDGTIAISLSNSLEIYKGKEIRQTTKNKNQIGYISGFAGSDFQHNNIVYILSEVAGHGHGNGIDITNITQALIYLAVRRSMEYHHDWLNHGDQFLAPNKDLSSEFISNCIVYALFNEKNNTSDCYLKYNDKEYHIINYFFPFTPQELGIRPADFGVAKKTMEFNNLINDNKTEFYMPDWLKQFTFTEKAKMVLEHCKKIYIGYENLLNIEGFNQNTIKNLQLSKNAGWYQIKRAFTISAGLKSYNAEKIDTWLNLNNVINFNWNTFDILYNELRKEIEKDVYEYGFLIK
jgi:hypothetical protein